MKWSKGVHQISFKSNSKSHGYDAIGISTNIEKLCEETGWYTQRANAANPVIYVKNGELMTGYPIDNFLATGNQARINGLSLNDCN